MVMCIGFGQANGFVDKIVKGAEIIAKIAQNTARQAAEAARAAAAAARNVAQITKDQGVKVASNARNQISKTVDRIRNSRHRQNGYGTLSNSGSRNTEVKRRIETRSRIQTRSQTREARQNNHITPKPRNLPSSSDSGSSISSIEDNRRSGIQKVSTKLIYFKWKIFF